MEVCVDISYLISSIGYRNIIFASFRLYKDDIDTNSKVAYQNYSNFMNSNWLTNSENYFCIPF